ncbi:MAG: T9SS type A sorting domain-containing protein [Saprospiraceae bacterium]|nr:T9SS type A sorting domain-containing protein [Saprospiraceae bacterium]
MKSLYFFLGALVMPLGIFAQITFQISFTNVNCNGGNNGTANVSAMGGSAPYSYVWSSGQQNASIFNLSAGTYTVTATDQSGSTGTKAITISQPPPYITYVNGQPQICDQAPDGFAYALPSGGTPPSSYSWSNGATAQLNNHLVAGSYTVTATDSKGCTSTKSYSVNYMGAGLYLFIDSENASCPESGNGSAFVTPASGTAPYQFQWENGAVTDTVWHLSPGTHLVTVTDANGCSASMEAIVFLDQVAPIVEQMEEIYCLNDVALLEADPAYSEFNWTLDNPADTLLNGTSNRLATIKWGAPGTKELKVEMGVPSTNCITTKYFQLQVQQCATAQHNVYEAANWLLTPNPFKEHMRVENLNGTAEIQIWNAQGALIMTQNTDLPTFELNTHALTAGLYFVKITDGQKRQSWRMVKE